MDDLLDVVGVRVRQVARRRVRGEQRGRDLVDVLVGRLGREDRGRQELERAVVDQRALGARVLERQARDHFGRARLRTSGSSHAPTLAV